MIRKVSLGSLCTLPIVCILSPKRSWRSAWSLTASAGAGVYTEPSMSITVTSRLCVVLFTYGQTSRRGTAARLRLQHGSFLSRWNYLATEGEVGELGVQVGLWLGHREPPPFLPKCFCAHLCLGPRRPACSLVSTGLGSVCCQHQPSEASQAVLCALCIQPKGQELGAAPAPRADVKSGCSPALRLQVQAAEHPVAAPGGNRSLASCCPWGLHPGGSGAAEGRAPNSQAVAGQSGCN